jgi:hypothetical protein
MKILVLVFALACAMPSVAAAKPVRVSLTADAGSGLLQPVVQLRRCGFPQELALGVVAVHDGRFALQHRHRKGRAKLRLQLAGEFSSELDAHGSLRGRVTFRGRRQVCRIPRLTWTASLPGPDEPDEEEFDDDDFVVDGELEDGEYEEDDEPVDEDDGP